MVKELVYAYAMWISPAFHLRVIRAFDDLLQGKLPGQQMPALDDPKALRGLLLGYTEKVIELESQVASMAPKAAIIDSIGMVQGDLLPTEAAKVLGMPPRTFTGWLEEIGAVYRRASTSKLNATQKWIERGYLRNKVTHEYANQRGEVIQVYQIYVTPAGLAKLARLLDAKRMAA